jgi:hypothetical protein
MIHIAWGRRATSAAKAVALAAPRPRLQIATMWSQVGIAGLRVGARIADRESQLAFNPRRTRGFTAERAESFRRSFTSIISLSDI